MQLTARKENKQVYGLDHLRAAAIILVFLYHYGKLFPSPAWVTSVGKFGWTGVDLFFVLSGYLIGSQLFAESAAHQKNILSRFYIKRSFRILPAYLLTFLCYLLFPFLREREGLAPTWKYLTFTQNIGLDLQTQGTFSHAWSLCVEEQFYFLFPLILLVMVYGKLMRKGWIVLIMLFIITVACRLNAWHRLAQLDPEEVNVQLYWLQWIYYPPWSRLDGLLTGVAIAAVIQWKPGVKNWLFKHGYRIGGAGLVLLLLASLICLDQSSYAASIYGFLMIAIGYGWVLIFAISKRTHFFSKRSAVTSNIATLSFGMYLTHKMVIHVMQDYLSATGIEKNSNAMFIACIGACIATAYILNLVIEKPFLKVRNRILQRHA